MVITNIEMTTQFIQHTHAHAYAHAHARTPRTHIRTHARILDLRHVINPLAS
jgi:hypothetical protein